jgi:fluoride exporter
MYCWIGLGGALGSIARFATYGLIIRLVGTGFPWWTLIVNVVGSAFVGFFAGLTQPDGRWFISVDARRFVIVGLCGGYTTFSTFSLETLFLVRDAQWLWAAANVIGTVIFCLLGVWAGHALTIAMNK